MRDAATIVWVSVRQGRHTSIIYHLDAHCRNDAPRVPTALAAVEAIGATLCKWCRRRRA